jgi:hypothetical protein
MKNRWAVQASVKIKIACLALSLLTTTSCGNNTFKWECNHKTISVSTQQVVQLLIPPSVFPISWSVQGAPRINKDFDILSEYSRLVAVQTYNIKEGECFRTEVKHTISVYGSEDCINSESGFPMHRISNRVEWMPLTNWKYSSPIADEYNLAIYHPVSGATDSMCQTNNEIIRVEILARYGTVMSYFVILTHTVDITPEQVMNIVMSLDKQFAAHTDLWRD